MTFLGVDIAKTYAGAIQSTYNRIDGKAEVRRIKVMTGKTNIIHKKTLLVSAYLPLYTNAILAMGCPSNICNSILKDMSSILWVRMEGGQTIQKRRQVSIKRYHASIGNGGLCLPHPKAVSDGIMLNTMQRFYRMSNGPRRPNIVRIIDDLCAVTGRPGLRDHFEYCGSREWKQTGLALKRKDKFISHCFYTMAKFLSEIEQDKQSCLGTAIFGNSILGGLNNLTMNESFILQNEGITLVGHMYSGE